MGAKRAKLGILEFLGLGDVFFGILEFLSIKIPNFSGVLGATAPKGLGRSPYKICELG